MMERSEEEQVSGTHRSHLMDNELKPNHAAMPMFPYKDKRVNMEDSASEGNVDGLCVSTVKDRVIDLLPGVTESYTIMESETIAYDSKRDLELSVRSEVEYDSTYQHLYPQGQYTAPESYLQDLSDLHTHELSEIKKHMTDFDVLGVSHDGYCSKISPRQPDVELMKQCNVDDNNNTGCISKCLWQNDSMTTESSYKISIDSNIDSPYTPDMVGKSATVKIDDISGQTPPASFYYEMQSARDKVDGLLKTPTDILYRRMQSTDTPSVFEQTSASTESCDKTNDDDLSSDDEVLPPMNKMPDIYNTDDLSYDERYFAYVDDIKIHERPSVWHAVSNYLSRHCADKSWLAIWRSSSDITDLPDNVDIVVWVADVECTTLLAYVSPYKPLLCEPASSTLESIELTLRRQDYMVPVVQLYPVYLETKPQKYGQLAHAIEHIRFFQQFLYRGWDEEDQEDFPLYLLQIRLKLYYDMQDKVPNNIAQEFFSTLSNYHEKHRRYLDLNKSLRVSDSETELDELEVCQIVEYHDLLQGLKQPLQMWENPMLRATFCNVTRSQKADSPGRSRMTRERPITYLVTESLTAGMVQNLDPDTRLKHRESPGGALLDCCNGDTIIIYPGTYPGDGFYDLTHSIHIKGYGDMPRHIVVESDKGSDVFVDTTADDITVENVTFYQVFGTTSNAMCVRRGHVTLDNCVIDCNGGNGIYLKEWTSLTLRNCILKNSKCWGIEAYQTSTVAIEGSQIINCGLQCKGGGILIKMVDKSTGLAPRCSLINSSVVRNDGYGLVYRKKEECGGLLDDKSSCGDAVDSLLDMCSVVHMDQSILRDNSAGNILVQQATHTGDSALWGDSTLSITPHLKRYHSNTDLQLHI